MPREIGLAAPRSNARSNTSPPRSCTKLREQSHESVAARVNVSATMASAGQRYPSGKSLPPRQPAKKSRAMPARGGPPGPVAAAEPGQLAPTSRDQLRRYSPARNPCKRRTLRTDAPRALGARLDLAAVGGAWRSPRSRGLM